MLEIPTPVLVLWLAIFIDLGFGEPPNRLHPVAWAGKAIMAFQLRAPKRGRWLPLVAGGLLVFGGVAASAALGYVLHVAASRFPLPLAILAEAVAVKFTFSVRGLVHASQLVKRALQRRDLAAARSELSWHLVSRDTSTLDESQVAAATIESLSENASDSCIAPWLYYAIGGLPAAMAYRFINTSDAMLGYRDQDREWLGKPAARLDDLINLLPSRVTAVLIISASVVLGGSPRRAAGVWMRDCHQTDSPNAGHPMSAAAGVLGVELEKIGHYRLGCGQRSPGISDIARAQWLLEWTAALAAGALSALLIASA
jgi:adenosylcobinamide-phosphate synthase